MTNKITNSSDRNSNFELLRIITMGLIVYGHIIAQSELDIDKMNILT